MDIVWRPFEIHPEVPPEGLPLSTLPYPPAELAAMTANLRRHAAFEGLDFADRSPKSLLVNTHRALGASVYAQTEEPERFAAFHHALFRANFVEGRNIGTPVVLRELAASAGLDVARLDAALAAGTYDAALREATEEALERSITAVPAFVFAGRIIIVGAHPPSSLQQAAERALAGR